MKTARALATVLLFSTVVMPSSAPARDNGQWATDSDVSNWFRNLMQPDNPLVSCCGEADAYYADAFERDDQGRTVAIITDERPDGPLNRPHVAPGTRIIVPDRKLKWDAGNPTGHGVIFMTGGGDVYCYITPGGV